MKSFTFGQHVFIGAVSFCAVVVFLSAARAASLPLPQKIVSPQLQRMDCVSGSSEAAAEVSPFIEEFTFTDARANVTLYSCVNWTEGFLKSEGIGKKGSARAAELVARNNALKTLLVVNLHSRFTFDEYFATHKETSLKIQNVLIKNAQIFEMPKQDAETDGDAKVMVTIPFYGISGVISFLLGDQELYLTPEQLRMPSALTLDAVSPDEGDAPTEIILDARGVSPIQPALLPKILSEDGEILYEASQVERGALQARGMIHYATGAPAALSKRAVLIRPLLIASAADDAALSRLIAQAQERKRRQGNALVVEAVKSDGQIPVNVVVSVEDAKKIKELNRTQQTDKSGSYTILIGGEIGGVKGEYPESRYAGRCE